jgi:hypothetical protein
LRQERLASERPFHDRGSRKRGAEGNIYSASGVIRPIFKMRNKKTKLVRLVCPEWGVGGSIFCDGIPTAPAPYAWPSIMLRSQVFGKPSRAVCRRGHKAGKNYQARMQSPDTGANLPVDDATPPAALSWQ